MTAPESAAGMQNHGRRSAWTTARGGGVRATGGVAMESQHRPEKKAGEGLPYLKIMAAVVVLVLLGLAWLALNGY